MNKQSTAETKRLLVILWLAMLCAVAVYYGLTYLIPGVVRPQPPHMKVMLGILQVLAAVWFLTGMVVEGIMIARAANPGSVVRTGIVSAAFGEAIAIFGLLWFFISHERIWEFFAVSGLYFVRLFVKLPDFNAKIDSLSQ